MIFPLFLKDPFFKKKIVSRRYIFYIFNILLINEKLYFSKNTIVFNKFSLVKSYWE